MVFIFLLTLFWNKKMILPLLLNFVFQYAIKKVQKYQEGLELNEYTSATGLNIIKKNKEVMFWG